MTTAAAGTVKARWDSGSLAASAGGWNSPSWSRDDPWVVCADADGFPAGAIRLLAGTGGVPVATATGTLDDASAVCDDGQRRLTWGATCSRPSSSPMNMMSHGQKSVERARRPGRLTDIAAGGSVAKLANGLGQRPTAFARGSGPGLAGGVSLHHPGSHHQPVAGPSPGSRTTRRHPPGMAGPSAVDLTIRGIGGRERLCCRLTAATKTVASEAGGSPSDLCQEVPDLDQATAADAGLPGREL
jgi:hypothetical protein